MMHENMRRRFAVCCALIALGGMSVSIGARADDDTKSKSAESKAAKKDRAPARGYLPPYYKNVIDGVQREKIYKIQDQYEGKIEDLEKQIKALTDQRDAEIEALLTPEQKKRLKEIAAESKDKPGKKAAGDKADKAAKPEASAAK